MNVPRQLGTPEETFEALCKQFNLSNPVKECILKQGVKLCQTSGLWCKMRVR